ncbi:MAG: hypothetical protein OES90_10060 [Xanthomonadales bacterium]|nr:hypothetical protein [Xanthomonadales bacterium]
MIRFKKKNSGQLICLSVLALAPALSLADLLTFQASDFGLNPTFSDVQTFAFTIDLAVPVTAGTGYSDPALTSVNYIVSGTLDGTPSGFPAFNLVREILGAEFYTQGSSMEFEVSITADLSDGVQVSELVGTGIVFEFNGREVGTGRYHPALVQLNADGTGTIQNSNNMGGINPASGMEVDVDFGEEYITGLTFKPSSLTIIPVPPDLVLMDGFEDP